MTTMTAFLTSPTLLPSLNSSSPYKQWTSTKATKSSIRRRQYPSLSVKPEQKDLSIETIEVSVASTRNPVIILPGLGNAASDYEKLAEKLRQRGHTSVIIAPIQRWQWILNVRGFFTAEYWQSKLTPSPILDWYLTCIQSTIDELLSVTPSASPASTDKAISILGHSAGGWLARVYLSQNPTLKVSSLVTLGTPHTAPPEGVIDQTRGLLTYVANKCGIAGQVDNFTCVAGQGTQGMNFGKGSISEYVAYISYAAVCGQGDVDGDGVTPLQAACAPGADEVVVCKCEHSMLTSPSNWYGSDHIIPEWADQLL